MTLRNLQGQEKHVFSPDEGMQIEMDVVAPAPVDDFVFGIGLFNSQGISCYGTNTNLEDYEPVSLRGEGRVVFRIERLNLVNGTYYLDVAVHKTGRLSVRLPQELVFVPRLLDLPGRGRQPAAAQLELFAGASRSRRRGNGG